MTADEVVAPVQAEVLAARIFAAIDNAYCPNSLVRRYQNADKVRVATDLAGLGQHHARTDDPKDGCAWCSTSEFPVFAPCPDAVRYAGGLRLTASTYGVTP